jgi:hypothetical protein
VEKHFEGQFEGILSGLDRIREIAIEKYQKRTVPDSRRMGWGRLYVAACDSYMKGLEALAIVGLERRIEALELERLRGTSE